MNVVTDQVQGLPILTFANVHTIRTRLSKVLMGQRPDELPNCPLMSVGSSTYEGHLDREGLHVRRIRRSLET